MNDGPSKEKLMREIQPGMQLTKDFFKRVYGYEISFPGFANQAITALEAAGCSQARQYYTDWVNDSELAQREAIHKVAVWQGEQLDRQHRKGIIIGKDGGDYERTEQNKILLQNLTSDELKLLCKRLLSSGIISSPEQFVTLVGQEF